MSDVPLREHIERILAEQDKARIAAFHAEKEKIGAMINGLEQRLFHLSALRDDVLKQGSEFVKMEVFNSVTKHLSAMFFYPCLLSRAA
jgi:hypothetical protein